MLLNICKARHRFGIQSRWCIAHEDPSCLLLFARSMLFNDISVLILFYNPKQFGASVLARPVAKGNQGWVNQRTGSPAGRREGYEAHMQACVSFHHRRAWSWRRAGHPNRNVFQLARKGPDQMLRRCSFQRRLSKRAYGCNTVMSLSTLVGRAIKPHDTGEPSSLSQASDHYIDSPTGSASPLQKREL